MKYLELLGTLFIALVVLMVIATGDSTVPERVRSFYRGFKEVCWFVFGTILLVPAVFLIWIGFLLYQFWVWFWFGERSTYKASDTPWMSP